MSEESNKNVGHNFYVPVGRGHEVGHRMRSLKSNDRFSLQFPFHSSKDEGALKLEQVLNGDYKE